MAAQRVSWILCGALLAVGTWSCEKKEAQVVKKAVVYKGPISETTNVLTLISDSAKLQVRLAAPSKRITKARTRSTRKG
ncbi:hypothetical protein [Hymenobacter cellulosilyticus]|uniref:Uncharacterized protein n=1 Tax=Hymenobacter cellulosilyticus TaxID=2932248 RepID=A0A8T9QCT4_9BACT|nr:hypothetical protein [Hymenobacter cellulosilyticus]UOQ73389.1 hypothetical protein MUN79_05390 [Hymenobacter cellulosilyticus]